MSFWSTDFMNDRRKQWLAALVKFQFRVGSTWHDAVINTKRIVGNRVEIIVIIRQSDDYGSPYH